MDAFSPSRRWLFSNPPPTSVDAAAAAAAGKKTQQLFCDAILY
jgi:hypothetical protein